MQDREKEEVGACGPGGGGAAGAPKIFRGRMARLPRIILKKCCGIPVRETSMRPAGSLRGTGRVRGGNFPFQPESPGGAGW